VPITGRGPPEGIVDKAGDLCGWRLTGLSHAPTAGLLEAQTCLRRNPIVSCVFPLGWGAYASD
jgi:hypothetical protein